MTENDGMRKNVTRSEGEEGDLLNDGIAKQQNIGET